MERWIWFGSCVLNGETGDIILKVKRLTCYVLFELQKCSEQIMRIIVL
jgi:hypothetical protein